MIGINTPKIVANQPCRKKADHEEMYNRLNCYKGSTFHHYTQTFEVVDCKGDEGGDREYTHLSLHNRWQLTTKERLLGQSLQQSTAGTWVLGFLN